MIELCQRDITTQINTYIIHSSLTLKYIWCEEGGAVADVLRQCPVVSAVRDERRSESFLKGCLMCMCDQKMANQSKATTYLPQTLRQMRKYINSNNTLWKSLLSDKSLNSDHERGHLPPFPPVTSTIHFSLHSSLSKGMLWASATVSYLIPHTCCLLIVLKPHCGKGPCSLSNDKSMR